jgi:hypothetical protein
VLVKKIAYLSGVTPDLGAFQVKRTLPSGFTLLVKPVGESIVVGVTDLYSIDTLSLLDVPRQGSPNTPLLAEIVAVSFPNTALDTISTEFAALHVPNVFPEGVP